MIDLDWSAATPVWARCPVCHHTGPMTRVLRYQARDLEIMEKYGWIVVLRCPCCEVKFCDPMVSVDYVDADSRGLKYYLESGAAIDVMLGSLGLADARPVRTYLEIGCSFGFVMDYAQAMLGWEVRGFDPGVLARFGRRRLGLPITSGYFRAGTGHDGWADLVYCSEVIEHVPDPADFAGLLAAAVKEDGQVILTTPDGDELDESTPLEALLPILSPSQHIIFYNPKSLETLFNAHGFADVRVEKNSYQLRVAASRRPRAGDSPWFTRALYRDYLATRLGGRDPDDPLGVGFAYRLLKEEVNTGRYDRARPVYDGLRRAIRHDYGLDIDDPMGFPFPDPSWGWEEWARSYPFNLCGVWYFRAIIALLADRDEKRAGRYFSASRRFGYALRRMLREVGTDDLETVDLARKAAIEEMPMIVRSHPALALESFRSLAEAPEEIRTKSRRVLFTDLVNLGHLDAAEEILASGDLGLARPVLAEEMALANAMGVYLLNRGLDPLAAASLFHEIAAVAESGARAIFAQREAMAWDAAARRIADTVFTDPALALQASRALDGAPVSARAPARRRIFTDLVNLGHLAEAEEVLASGDLSLDRPVRRKELELGNALALYALNRSRDYAAAAELFAEIAGVTKGEIRWHSQFHQALAMRCGGDEAGAAALAAKLAGARAAAGMPALPEDLLGRLAELQSETLSE